MNGHRPAIPNPRPSLRAPIPVPLGPKARPCGPSGLLVLLLGPWAGACTPCSDYSLPTFQSGACVCEDGEVVDLDACDVPDAPLAECPDRPPAESVVPDPGSTVDEAFALGTLGSRELCLAQDGSIDPLDLLTFSVDAPSELSMLVTSVVSGCGNWFGSTGCLLSLAIDDNANGFIEPDEVRSSLSIRPSTAQTWYIPHDTQIVLVFDAGGNIGQGNGGTFSVNFTATPYVTDAVSPPSDPGAHMEEAIDLPLGARWIEQVGTFDDADWYRLELSAGAGLVLRTPTLEGAPSSYRLVNDANANQLPDPSEVVASGRLREDAPIELPLGTGTYFLEVTGGGNGSIYELSAEPL